MAEVCEPTIDVGLRGVVVASTHISKVDGAAGKLIYRGYLVKDLAESSTYEEIVFLLFLRNSRMARSYPNSRNSWQMNGGCLTT
jgi:citrate synthase